MSAFVIDQHIRDTDVSELKVHPKNARRGNLRTIGKSIEVNGFYGTIVAQKSTGYVLAGNHRYLAAVEAGLTVLPVAWVDCDNATAKRILLVDNKANDDADYDTRELAEILSSLSNEEGLEGSGYDEGELEKLIADLEHVARPHVPKNREIDPDGLLPATACMCPRCGFEFEPDK